MKILLAVILCATAAIAQPRVSLTSTYAAPGTPAKVDIVLAGGGMNPAGVQFTMAIPAGATITPGAMLAGASKGLYYFVNPTTNVATMFVIDGMGTIPDGILASINFTAAPFQFTPTQPIAVDNQGNAGTFTAGGYNFGSSCDLNADGQVTKADEQIAKDQATRKTACVSADLTGDGICTIQDVQRVIVAVNGGACKVGP